MSKKFNIAIPVAGTRKRLIVAVKDCERDAIREMERWARGLRVSMEVVSQSGRVVARQQVVEVSAESAAVIGGRAASMPMTAGMARGLDRIAKEVAR